MQRVPRWVPKAASGNTQGNDAAFSWTKTFFSERGTLIAIGVGYVLLALKARFS